MFLKGKYAAVLTVALIAQGALYYSASGGERAPLARPLSAFPAQIQSWSMMQEYPIEKEVLDVLRADDVLSRFYVNSAANAGASLFVAYFKTQRTGQAPHSPKNCLPGSGWEPSATGNAEVPVEGWAQPLRVNRYVVSKGDQKSVVLYWYQSRNRVIASEYAAKFWLVVDSIRYHRSDTALVRIVVPVVQNQDERATATGVEFVKAVFPVLHGFLPS